MRSLTDLDGRVVRANAVAEQLLVNQRRHALVGTLDRGAGSARIRRSVRAPPRAAPCSHDDGTELLIDLTFSAIDVPEGPHMLVIVEDVTDTGPDARSGWSCWRPSPTRPTMPSSARTSTVAS